MKALRQWSQNAATEPLQPQNGQWPYGQLANTVSLVGDSDEPDAHSTKRTTYSAPIVSVMWSVVLSHLQNYTIVTMKYKCMLESEY